MINTKKGNSAIAFFASAFISIVSIFTAATILRNLGWLLGNFVEPGVNDKFDFVRIFEQTKNAGLSIHCFFPILLGLLFLISNFYLFPKIKNKVSCITLAIFLFILLFIIAFVCSLLLTRVNGIRFCDLLYKLLPLIDKL